MAETGAEDGRCQMQLSNSSDLIETIRAKWASVRQKCAIWSNESPKSASSVCEVNSIGSTYILDPLCKGISSLI